jgi:hypothetical protein
MARLPRLVLPGIPHHITQRGNRRERTLFEEGDYALYLDLLAQAAHDGAPLARALFFDREGRKCWAANWV